MFATVAACNGEFDEGCHSELADALGSLSGLISLPFSKRLRLNFVGKIRKNRDQVPFVAAL